MQQFIVKGIFTMAVDATNHQDAKQAAKRILRGEGVKAVALEANENRGNGKGKRGRKK